MAVTYIGTKNIREVVGSSPQYRGRELDQTAPAGLWRTIYTGDTMTIQRATSADWSSSEDWITLDKGAEEIQFSKTVNMPANVSYGDDENLNFGDDDDASFAWDTTDANANALELDLPSGGAVNVPVLAVGIGIHGVDLGLFDGITQPTVAVLDADRDAYVALYNSADDIPAIRFVRSTQGSGVRLAQQSGAALLASDTLALRSTTAGNDVELSISPLDSTEADAAITLADSGATDFEALHIRITASSDIRFDSTGSGTYTAVPITFEMDGAEVWRIDGSGNFIVNQDGLDHDFRVESENSENIILVDAALDTITFGTTAVGWSFARFAGSFTSDGSADVVFGVTFDVDVTGAAGDTTFQGLARMAGSVTTNGLGEAIGVIATLNIREPDISLSGADTATIAATFYIQGGPSEGDDNYALVVDAGASRFDGIALFGATDSTFSVGSAHFAGGFAIGADSTDNQFDDASNGSGSTQMFIGNSSIDVTASDIRLKARFSAPNGLARRHLDLLSDALEEYEYVAGQKAWVGNRYVGLVAQRLDAVLPEYVVRPDDPESTWAVKYDYMVGPLLWGWQDHESRIETLEEKAERLETENESLRARLAALGAA